jgi:hypothetical protein
MNPNHSIYIVFPKQPKSYSYQEAWKAFYVEHFNLTTAGNAIPNSWIRNWGPVSCKDSIWNLCALLVKKYKLVLLYPPVVNHDFSILTRHIQDYW